MTDSFYVMMHKLRMLCANLFCSMYCIGYHLIQVLKDIKAEFTKDKIKENELLFYRTLIVGLILFNYVPAINDSRKEMIFYVVRIFTYLYLGVLGANICWDVRRKMLLEQAEKKKDQKDVHDPKKSPRGRIEG